MVNGSRFVGFVMRSLLAVKAVLFRMRRTSFFVLLFALESVYLL